MKSPRDELRWLHTDDDYGKRWWITFLRDGVVLAVFETAKTEVMAAAFHLLEQSDDPEPLAEAWAARTHGPDWILDGELGDELVQIAATWVPEQPRG